MLFDIGEEVEDIDKIQASTESLAQDWKMQDIVNKFMKKTSNLSQKSIIGALKEVILPKGIFQSW